MGSRNILQRYHVMVYKVMQLNLDFWHMLQRDSVRLKYKNSRLRLVMWYYLFIEYHKIENNLKGF